MLCGEALEEQRGGFFFRAIGAAAQAQQVVQLGIIRPHGQGLAESRSGLCQAAGFAEGECGEIPSIAVVGAELRCSLEGADGTVNRSGVEEKMAELAVEAGSVGKPREGSTTDVEGGAGSAHEVVDRGEPGVGVRVVGLELEEGAVAEGDFLEASDSHGGGGPAAPDARVDRVEVGGSPV